MILLAALLAVSLSGAPPVEVQRPHDDAPGLALAWTAVDGCPTRAALLERIAAQGVAGQIGDWVPERHGRARLEVVVEVVGEGERVRADLRLRDADGESARSFSAASCEALADATALIVAVTLDPVGVASLHASVAAGSPEPEPKPEPEPTILDIAPLEDPPIDLSLPAEPEPEPQRWPEALRVGLSIHAGGGWSPVATLAGALGGRLALLGPRFRAELGGRWSTPRRLEANGAAGVFDAWVVEARGCFVPTARRLEFPLCPGVELGSVRGRGAAPTSSPTERAFLWVAPSLSQGLSWAPVERFAIGVELGLVVPVTRGRFVVGDSVVGDIALVGGRALASLEFRLP